MECAICMEFYDDQNHQPTFVVPCFHTFCQNCLSNLNSVGCPNCSQKITSKHLNPIMWELVTSCCYDQLLKQIELKECTPKCQRCLKPFDHSKNKPISFAGCFHTYCRECRVKLNKISKSPFCPGCNSNRKSETPNWALLKLIPESSYDLRKKELEKSMNDANESLQRIKNKRLKWIYKRQFDGKFKQARKDLVENKLTESEMKSLMNDFDSFKSDLDTQISNSKRKQSCFLRVFCLTYFN